MVQTEARQGTVNVRWNLRHGIFPKNRCIPIRRIPKRKPKHQRDEPHDKIRCAPTDTKDDSTEYSKKYGDLGDFIATINGAAIMVVYKQRISSHLAANTTCTYHNEI